MATVTRRCKKCTARFRVSNQTRRIFCETCRPPRLKPLSDVPTLAESPRVMGEVEQALRGELERAGRMDRYQGVLAIRLARLLDGGTPASAPGLTSQIDQLMTKALEGAAREPDIVDELTEQRRAVRGAG